MNNKTKQGGLGIVSVLTIIFIVLKLLGVIKWSWIHQLYGLNFIPPEWGWWELLSVAGIARAKILMFSPTVSMHSVTNRKKKLKRNKTSSIEIQVRNKIDEKKFAEQGISKQYGDLDTHGMFICEITETRNCGFWADRIIIFFELSQKAGRTNSFGCSSF